MNNTIVAIGEALIDFIPDKSGCEFYEVGAFKPAPGGAPANVCGAFSKLGGKSRMLTQLGDDPFGDVIMRALNNAGIDTKYIPLTTKANTALAFVSLKPDGNRVFSFYRKPSADMLFSKEQVKEEMFEDCYALHFCSVSIGDFPMKDAHFEAIKLAKQKGALISFDPNLRFMLWDDKDKLKSAIDEFIPLTDIIKISDEELEFITGSDNPDEAFDLIFERGVKMVVYTCGKDGAYVILPDLKVYSPTVKVNAVDTTGAGDGFIGSFLWKLHESGIDISNLESADETVLKACADFANRFSSISVQGKGAIDSYPTIEQMS